ncbi:MAG: Signal peptidase-like protein [Ekhidna sp.]|nr:Signal peptidase-like protein [Ekhidna sp.]MBC6410700.1 Signal peptidase-like protein [Ekhidna sp.]MBC6424981.1 Signal peptidase-like protein [Ekhidna sp.]
MGCESCGTNGTAGCRNNGYCNSGGCSKLNVFNWLSNMDVPALHRFDVFEVRFKNGRKDFFRNNNKLDIVTGDAIVVDVPNGHHIGYVSLQGELVRLQMSKKGIENDKNVRGIYRKATHRDMERWQEARSQESDILLRTKEIVQDIKLDMKPTDVEFQADGTKAIFFYSAEGRVDFRELIRWLAGEFKIRIEMRQISVRQEAGRIGGIGACGRELCCSTWLSDFKSVTTAAVRYQNLSLNPDKISGQCGRLKCCLNYELDTYTEALKDIPDVEQALITQKGEAKLQKTDIFRKILWFSYGDDNNWHSVGVERVRQVQEMNKRGKKPFSLSEDKNEASVINSDLEEMEKNFSKRSKKKKRSKEPFRDKRKNFRESSR